MLRRANSLYLGKNVLKDFDLAHSRTLRAAFPAGLAVYRIFHVSSHQIIAFSGKNL